MSHLQFFSYEGFGDRVKTDTHYNQAVRIGDIIEISGQGGWDRITEGIPSDVGAEVDQAFANVEHALKQAGGDGWSQVYKVRVYCAPFDAEVVGHFVRNLKKYCPDHQPLLTGVGVSALYNNMRLEIEVAAHVGN
ncbi:Endoribonuclease L-PSP/chorismate mutase-like protein [Cladochytrium replicatum]|nr:Endoribonuclease L-PSP/chorismate mutase-like protein [Cladochytrium replicatum]